MEKYFPVVSKSSAFLKATDGKAVETRYQPYHLHQLPHDESSGHSSMLQTNGLKSSSSALNKFVLATLGHPSNPITHSDIGQRSDHVFSTSTGHQVSDRRRVQQPYLGDREHKLACQREADPSTTNVPKIFRNVRVYINGFLENTTDIEMKRIIIQHGGQVASTVSGCTHILTSQQLSGSKTHKILTGKTRIKVNVVKPEWVIDSVDAGRRKLERNYSVIVTRTTRNIQDLFQQR